MENKKDILNSYYRIRKLIGLLGLMLPVLVVLTYGKFLPSISHYYYTRSAVFFIAILSAFGLLLISYKGYERDKANERLSDNVITHIAGIAALLVVLFPTSCTGSNNEAISAMCLSKVYPLFGHRKATINFVHLTSAGIFLFTMGWMSIFRFTKGELTKEKKRKNKLYRITGYIVWSSIGILLVEFLLNGIRVNFRATNYDVYILETVAVFAFGLSWLVKGEAIRDIIGLKKKVFR